MRGRSLGSGAVVCATQAVQRGIRALRCTPVRSTCRQECEGSQFSYNSYFQLLPAFGVNEVTSTSFAGNDHAPKSTPCRLSATRNNALCSKYIYVDIHMVIRGAVFDIGAKSRPTSKSSSPAPHVISCNIPRCREWPIAHRNNSRMLWKPQVEGAKASVGIRKV